ncbi:MAG TPA: PIN domain-containing protein, partial [Roseiflexaceae bacterium]|nr:PIN domain-containing protein [Roseiflexaceae bacterium]
MPPRAVFDTNVFVAAGFNPASHAARLVGAVREGELTLVWNADTRAEVLNTLSRIPPLAGLDVAALFRPEAEFRAAAAPTGYGAIPDPADRVFAALADAAGVPLVTNDAHLLDHRAAMRVPVLTPRAFWDATMAARGTGTSGGEEAGPDTLRRLRSSPLWLLAAPATLWLCGAVYLPIAAPALVGTARWLVALILAVLTVLSFVAHALAHAAVARRLGAPLPDRIPLGLLGDVAQAWAPAAVPRHEALIALAGPGASAALAGLGGLLWSAQLGPAPDAAALFVAILNGALAALNLAPGFPLDGGRLVQLALQGVVRRPERVSAALGAALAC